MIDMMISFLLHENLYFRQPLCAAIIDTTRRTEHLIIDHVFPPTNRPSKRTSNPFTQGETSY